MLAGLFGRGNTQPVGSPIDVSNGPNPPISAGNNAILVGNVHPTKPVPANTVTINASNVPVNALRTNSTYLSPVYECNGLSTVLTYNSMTKEVCADTQLISNIDARIAANTGPVGLVAGFSQWSEGTGTYEVPSGSYAQVTLVGGGGAGATATQGVGGGGGGGSGSTKNFVLGPGTYNWAVGAGGTSQGANGTNSSFGSYVAAGGGGGSSGVGGQGGSFRGSITVLGSSAGLNGQEYWLSYGGGGGGTIGHNGGQGGLGGLGGNTDYFLNTGGGGGGGGIGGGIGIDGDFGATYAPESSHGKHGGGGGGGGTSHLTAYGNGGDGYLTVVVFSAVG